MDMSRAVEMSMACGTRMTVLMGSFRASQCDCC